VIIYSIIPYDIIFRDYDKFNESKYIVMDYLGERVQVMPIANNEYVIQRLLSTWPKSYLNPRLQPGTIIKG
jgi:hypothetical protein